MVSAVDIFSGDLTVDNMVMAMRFRFPEKKILPGKTLIFLDEIQECQEAITSLKFWAIDNRYDVIVSGSLLGIDYKRASSYPVGYVDYLRMYGPPEILVTTIPVISRLFLRYIFIKFFFRIQS